MPHAFDDPFATRSGSSGRPGMARGMMSRAQLSLTSVGGVGAWLTAEAGAPLYLHIAFGCTALCGLVGWGGGWWRQARRWPRVWRAVSRRRTGPPWWSALGLATSAWVALTLLAVTAASGWWPQAHKGLARGWLAAVAVHGGLVLALSLMRGRNMAWERWMGRRPQGGRQGDRAQGGGSSDEERGRDGG